MIVDIRTYDIVPRKMKTYLSLFEEYALPVLREYIGEPLGYFVVEHGTLNQVVHMCGYESLGDLEEKRQAREADPRWDEYLSKSEGLVTSQNNKLCRPTNWSSIK